MSISSLTKTHYKLCWMWWPCLCLDIFQISTSWCYLHSQISPRSSSSFNSLKPFSGNCDRWVPEECYGGGHEQRWVRRVGRRGRLSWEEPRWPRPGSRLWQPCQCCSTRSSARPQNGSQAGTHGGRNGRGKCSFWNPIQNVKMTKSVLETEWIKSFHLFYHVSVPNSIWPMP